MLRELLARMIEVGRLSVAIGSEPSFTIGAVPIDMPQLDVAIRLKDRWAANPIWRARWLSNAARSTASWS